MAGPYTPYHPTAKPGAAASSPYHTIRNASLPTWVLVLFLCFMSYLLGVWQHGGRIVPAALSTTVATVACPSSRAKGSSSSSAADGSTSGVTLDFESHHRQDDVGDAELDDRPKTYPACAANFSEYTPCEDVQRSLRFDRNRLIYRERHCPDKSEQVKCRVPAPYGYKIPFRWPASRDLAWYANVPHKELTVEKAVQNWIQFQGDRFRFPGGGTMFPRGAGAYIDDIGKLINLKDGSIRTAIDTGCGVASWGAYLLSRNVLTMSFAPRDSHEAQVQFALERGVPALIGVLASKRLPYPSRAFDMAHCSRCLIPWAQSGGTYLMEVDRVLRPGGYWILSGPPIRWRRYWRGWNRTQDDLSSEQNSIERVARSLCWTKLIEKGDIAVWQKPTNHLQCKVNQFCPTQDPDSSWYTNMDTCLTRLPEVSSDEEVAGGQVAKWPERLNAVPPRISGGTVPGITAEAFRADAELWKRRVSYYKTVNNQLGQAGRYRNLLDMNAHLGGFAAALVEDPVWVMNVVPVEASVNTLGVIYERGLIGTYQSWCEAMSTYPRTYDFIHADSLFSLYKDRCEADNILLEMDRILRPEGSVIIRDDVDVLVKLKRMIDGMNYDSQIVDHEDGPLVRQKLLFAVKSYWTAPSSSKHRRSSTSP
ncbi:hypothetical protein BT93_K2303 [Corymbia citriodora subsp. variegata]|nr:hypothetical protein BT93_K2303 [Corymbia citriodora subsp. variegata]